MQVFLLELKFRYAILADIKQTGRQCAKPGRGRKVDRVAIKYPTTQPSRQTYSDKLADIGIKTNQAPKEVNKQLGKHTGREEVGDYLAPLKN